MAEHTHLLRITCGRCVQAWAGADDRAHCARCHNTFDDVELFDAHRGDEGCRPPQALGLTATKNGIWCRPPSQIRRTG